MKEKIDLEKLEGAEFKISKTAVRPRSLTCSACKLKMKRAEIEVRLENKVYIRVRGFECQNCGKRFLGLDEARELDRALVVSRILHKDFKMQRSLSFDGDNYTFRIPKEFTHEVHKKKIEIVPLGAREFCVQVQ